MRYFCLLPILACAAEVPYSPTEQDFDELDDWGDGITGFDISSGPTDTGGGGSNGGSIDVNGVYLGTYSVSITRENYGDYCNGSASLTVAVTAESITVGQGSQIGLACGYCSDGVTTEKTACEGMGYSWLNPTTEYVSMRFRGDFDASGLIIGEVIEETAFGLNLSWTGVYSNGLLAGSFEQYVSSN
jgi:hypothetical protein